MRCHAFRVGVVGFGAIVLACARMSDPALGPASSALPPDAQAALYMGLLPPTSGRGPRTPVCVAVAPPIPLDLPVFQRIQAPLDSLSEPPARAFRLLRAQVHYVHPLSECSVTRQGNSPPEFRLRSSGEVAQLVWMRNAALVNDSTARALVGHWVNIDVQGERECETVRQDGVWTPPFGCKHIWAT